VGEEYEHWADIPEDLRKAIIEAGKRRRWIAEAKVRLDGVKGWVVAIMAIVGAYSLVRDTVLEWIVTIADRGNNAPR